MNLSRLPAWRSVLVSLGLALLLALGLAPAAWAATITVDGNCVDTDSDGLCDDTVTYRTIARAAAAATANDTLDIITSSTHTEAGVTITKTLTIQGQGQNTTIWQAAVAPGIAATRLFTVNPGIAVTVTAITLQYGKFNGAGGAIYNKRGTLTLESVNVLTNTSTGGGGALYSEAATGSASVWISSTLFSGNTTTNTVSSLGGGAIWSAASAGGTAIANIFSSQFVSNTAISGGGAIFSSNGSGTAALRVHNTVFLRNSGLSDFYGGGGAIRYYSNGGSNFGTVADSQFISNTTLGGGGALFNWVNSGTANLTISGTQFYSNTAQDDFYGGGAIYLTNKGTTNASITNSEFLTNTTGAGGGAIYQRNDAGTTTLTIAGTLFRNNHALDDSHGGGAVYNFSAGGIARTAIESSQLLSNTTAAMGGALANDGLDASAYAYLEVISSTLAYNTAVEGGGAIYNYDYNRDGGATVGLAQTMITGTVLAYNTVNDPAFGQNGTGGAVFSGALDTGSFAVFTAVNSTISGNTADGDGGAVYNDIYNRHALTVTVKTSAVMTLTQVTIVSNTSSSGAGGLYVDGFATDEYSRLDLRNTLISGNSGDECSGAGDVAGSSNFIDDTTCGSGAPFRLGSAQGTVLALAGNGGPTQTHALTNVSPAVDTADALYCPATDQRGTARPQGATCDVGAWEGVFAAITQFLAVDPPDGTVGQTYAYTLTADGFPVTITLQAGTLPPGLALGSNGALTGTPTLAGPYGGLVFRATNSLGQVDAITQSITINPGILISANPPDGQVGLAYSHTITATGAVISYTVTGALPPGLTFSTGGLLAGTPTLAGTYGGLVFRACNGALYSDSSPQTIVITEVVHITADPPDGEVGVGYSYNLGGSGNPLTYTLQAGTLPPGLTLSAGGVLSGTPTLAGSYSGLVFRADNGWDTEDTAALEIVITQEFQLYLPLVLGPDTTRGQMRQRAR